MCCCRFFRPGNGPDYRLRNRPTGVAPTRISSCVHSWSRWSNSPRRPGRPNAGSDVDVSGLAGHTTLFRQISRLLFGRSDSGDGSRFRRRLRVMRSACHPRLSPRPTCVETLGRTCAAFARMGPARSRRQARVYTPPSLTGVLGAVEVRSPLSVRHAAIIGESVTDGGLQTAQYIRRGA
jgi:hypothetical protein